MAKHASNEQRRAMFAQMRKGRLRQLVGFAKEEKATSKQYEKMGFKEQAKDESEHAKFFQAIAEKEKADREYWHKKHMREELNGEDNW